MELLKNVLPFLVMTFGITNCQPTSSTKCSNPETSCVNDDYDSLLASRIGLIEKELQESNNERSYLKAEIERLTEQLNNISQNPTGLSRPSNCAERYKTGQKTSGIYTVYPTDLNNIQHEVKVYCDMTTSGGGWTVFQRRYDGSVPFNKTWEEYKNGFGNNGGEYWLGNKYISMMTNSSSTKYTLRVDLTAFDGQTAYAEYSDFTVAPESDNFRLNFGTFIGGTAGDSLSYHNGMQFSTYDNDNDKGSYSCSQSYGGRGGWWFNDCHQAPLNGVYLTSEVSYYNSLHWWHWRSAKSLKASTMAIRPKDF